MSKFEIDLPGFTTHYVVKVQINVYGKIKAICSGFYYFRNFPFTYFHDNFAENGIGDRTKISSIFNFVKVRIIFDQIFRTIV